MSSYRLKKTEFLGRPTVVLCQNENGPCPLLAICNALLLQNQIDIHHDYAEVTLPELISLVANRLVEANSSDDAAAPNDEAAAARAANRQQALHDAIELLPSLGRGLDVNVRFDKCDGFEYTPECCVFDLLDLSLVHGWLVDPQEREPCRVIGDRSYNQVAVDRSLKARGVSSRRSPPLSSLHRCSPETRA